MLLAKRQSEPSRQGDAAGAARLRRAGVSAASARLLDQERALRVVGLRTERDVAPSEPLSLTEAEARVE